MVEEESTGFNLNVPGSSSMWEDLKARHFLMGKQVVSEKFKLQPGESIRYHIIIIHRNHPRCPECIKSTSSYVAVVLPLAKDETAARDERRRLG